MAGPALSGSEASAVIGGRVFGSAFRAEKLLKSHLGVETWLGSDVARDTPVVIKTLVSDSVPASVQHRFAHEAKVLRDLEGSHLTRLLDGGHQDGLLYFVMDYVPGRTLAERLAEGPLSPRDAIRVAECVTRALHDAHQHGVVHRDVKPANIIVMPGQDPSRVRSAVLVDFGLARSTALGAGLRDEPVGTVRYMSPEQAGLLSRDVDERSDLYSLGAVLFECVTGRAPFLGETLTDLLRQHLSVRPPTMGSLVPGTPSVLDAIVGRLLKKDPRDRYQSAEGVLQDLGRLGPALDRGDPDPYFVIGAGDRRRTLTEPTFVGRTVELEALRKHVRGAMTGRGGLVLLEGESGAGKTRALDELERHASQEGAWVLRGKGLAEVGQRPFQVLVGLAEEVNRRASLEPGFAASLRKRLGDLASAVCSALPELGETFGPSAGDSGPEVFGETRTIQALTAWLDALGLDGHPAVVILDDCQWADAGALQLLRHWANPRRVNGHGRATSLVAAFRAEEVGPGHPLRRIDDAPAVKLGPLSLEETRALVASMAGALPDDVVAAVHRLAVGSPFMEVAVLRGLVEVGAVSYENERWVLDEGALDAARSSGEAAAFLSKRFSLLPEEALSLLSVGAVLGREFDMDVATTLSGVTPQQALSAVDEARSRHMVWLKEQDARVVFVHDKLRETLLARLSPDHRRGLHFAAAKVIETQGPRNVFDLAYHYDAAGAGDRALPYALEGAALARAQYALDIAEQQYAIAARGASPNDHAVQLRIAEGRGDVAMLGGRYDAAVTAFRGAKDLARDNVDKARLAGKLGELAFKRGDVATAAIDIESGLALLGRTIPRSTVACVVFCIWEVLVQAMHSLMPTFTVGRRALTGAESDLRSVRLYSRLAYAYWFGRGKIPCLWAHLRGMNLAERYPPTPELGQAYSEHAPVMTTIPLIGRGMVYAERSYAIRTALADPWGQAQALNFQGTVLYAASRFQECIDGCKRAVRLFERTGDLWERHTALWHIAYGQYRLGRLAEAAQTGRLVHQAGADIGDIHASAIGLTVWCKAIGGAMPLAPVEGELARAAPEDVHTLAELHQAKAIISLRLGAYDDAIATLEIAQKMIDERGFRQEYVAPVLPWLATALRRKIEVCSPFSRGERQRLLDRFGEVAHRALRLARDYGNNLPHALREMGFHAALHERDAEARRYFDQSLAEAKARDMKQEEALTLAARGAVGAALAWKESAFDTESALRASEALERAIHTSDRPLPAEEGQPVAGIPASVSLVDRFENILDAGRLIGRSLDVGTVFDAVASASQRLLRAEQTIIVLVHRSAQGGVMFESREPATYSATIIREAIERGRPVVMTESRDDTSESVLLSGVRSVLCAPIHIQGEVIACLYVTHSQVGHLFGEVEVRLAEFIASIGGVAFENAEGLARTQALAEERARLYEQAQSAIRGRDEFLSIASHELKTPLTPLQLQLQHLQRGIARGNFGPERIASKIEVALRQTERLSTLIENLLDVSRIRAGRFKLQPESIDLREVIVDVVDRFASEARAANCHIAVKVMTAMVGRWDRMRLEQVLANLLSNAIKYGAGKPISIDANMDVDTVNILVEDGGIGIPPEDMARLFERFERGSSVRKYGGLGLGLYIVRQIVEAHGGVVTVTSEVGHGAVFTVALPRETVTGRFDPVAKAI